MQSSSLRERASSSTSSKADRNELEMLDTCVDVSVLINQLFVHTLKAQCASSKVDTDVFAISAAFEQLTSSISEIASSAEQVHTSSRGVSESVGDGQRISARAIENMQTIGEAVSGARQRSMELEQAALQIERSLSRIQSIANQTNLLALNATIQAARAGEAGRGFAVVAEEVKQLSAETGKAAGEISSVLQVLTSALRTTVSSMEEVSEVVADGEAVSREVSGCMGRIEEMSQDNLRACEEITRALEQQSSATTEVSEAAQSIKGASQQSAAIAESNAGLGRAASQRMESLIKHVAECDHVGGQAVVKLAKSDHLVWKRKFHDLLFGDTKLTEADLVSHEHCRLGRWYYSEGRERLQDTAAFHTLEPPHRRIHELGRRIFDLVSSQRREDALSLLDDFESTSTQVLDLLDRLDEALDAPR